MKILDATAGQRGIWYQKEHPFVVFLDQRCGKYSSKTDNCRLKNERIYDIYPTVVSEWQHLPFPDNCFDMIVFDPPHIFKDKGQKLPGMSAEYGVFYRDNWRKIVSDGTTELFRCLKTDGFFILKWCEIEKNVDEVLTLIPYKPLFGTRTGQSNKTHWICFLKHKPPFERTLEDFTFMKDA